MEQVYIIAAKRTAIGRFQGQFKSVPAPKLGAVAIKAVVDEVQKQSPNFNPQLIDEVIMGQVLTAGVGQAPARQASIYAGIPNSVPALTIGKVCGSGLKSVMLAANAIRAQDAHLVVAGGQESMSNAPYLLKEARDGYRMGNKEVIDSMMFDGLFDPYYQSAMGVCAESCVTETQISREAQDNFAIESYTRARKAIASGAFTREIASVEVTTGKNTVRVETDEEPAFSDLAKLPTLRPVFDKEGAITAGNASKINDGAAAVLLASETAVKKYNFKPAGKILSYATFAQDPKWFTTAPIEAIKKALQKVNLKISDIDLFEINEAFSVVTLAACKALEIPLEKVNVHGGAVALGHPIGASGTRILVSLLHALESHSKRYGLATLCIGGGEAVAMIVERN